MLALVFMVVQRLALEALIVSRSTRSITTRSLNIVARRWTSLTRMNNLVDVDCNLWHNDLQEFSRSQQSLFATTNEGEVVSESPFHILDFDAVEEAGVKAMVSPSSTLREAMTYLPMLQNRDTAAGFTPIVKSTVGVHPYHVNDKVEDLGTTREELIDRMTDLLQTHRDHCCAVGECGLDASEGFPPMEDQIPWFQAQVEVAQKLQLPLFVHERLAFEETMSLLHDCSVPVIVHCFTGNIQQCEAYIQRGYSISLSGYIFRDDAIETQNCLREGLIPLDRLMIETDAPYLGFNGCRDLYCSKHEASIAGLNSKKRKRLISTTYPNLPSSLPCVLSKVVELLNQGRSQRNEPHLTEEDVANATTENACKFFGFSNTQSNQR